MSFRILTETSAFLEAFLDTVDWAEDLDLVYAWAHSGEGAAAHWEALAAASAKLRRVVIGVSFLQTEAAALEQLLEWGCLRVIDQKDGTFHPKVTLARRGEEVRALVGSSNLTRGGFGPNTELNILTEGRSNDAEFAKLTDLVNGIWSRSIRPSPAWLAEYATCREEAKASPEPAVPELPQLPPGQSASTSSSQPSGEAATAHTGGESAPPTLPAPGLFDAAAEPESRPEGSQDAEGQREAGGYNPYGPRLLLQRAKALGHPFFPPGLLGTGFLAVELLSRTPHRLTHESDDYRGPPVFVQRSGTGDGMVGWVVGVGTLAVAGLASAGDSAPTEWRLPIGDWAFDDMCHSYVLPTLHVHEQHLVAASRDAPTASVRVQEGVAPMQDVAGLLGQASWVRVGQLDQEDQRMLAGVVDDASGLFHGLTLCSGPEAVFVEAGADGGAQLRHRIGDGVPCSLEMTFPSGLLEQALWGGPLGEVLVEPALGVVALRFPEHGLAILGQGSRQSDDVPVGVAEPLLSMAASDARAPVGVSDFVLLFLESVRWVMASPGIRPCATVYLDDGLFELANFARMPGDPRVLQTFRILELNVTDRESLGAVTDKVDLVRDALGLKLGSVGWTDTSVMDAVSFYLPDIDCAVELAMMAEKVLEILWGRAPTIDDVTSIEWRFLETRHGRGRSRKAKLRNPEVR